MAIYKCRMPSFDGDDDWTDVESPAADTAAAQYAEDCDSDQAMELFDGLVRREVVVKSPDGSLRKFNCQCETILRYFSEEIDPAPDLPESDIPY